MKSSKLTFLFMVLAIAVAVFSGCSTEGMDTSERLAGTWTVTSFDETEPLLNTTADIFDADEVSSFTISFTDETTARGNVGRGSFTWNMVADNTTANLEGTYSVTAESGRLEMTFTTGSWADLFVENPANQLIVFDYFEDGSILTLRGLVNNFTWEIEAEK